MNVNELTAKHVKEFGDLNKQQENERQNLFKQQSHEIQTKGASLELARQQTQATINLDKVHSQQLSALSSKHEQELQQFEQTKNLLKTTQENLAYADQLEKDFHDEQKRKADTEYQALQQEALAESDPKAAREIARQKALEEIKKQQEQARELAKKHERGI